MPDEFVDIQSPQNRQTGIDMRGARILNCPSFAGGGVGTLTQVLTAGNSATGLGITNLLDPVNPQDAATKAYVDGLGVPTLSAVLMAGSDGGAVNITNLGSLTASNNVKATAFGHYVVLDSVNAQTSVFENTGVGTSRLATIGGGVLSIDLNGGTITSLVDPTNPQDAATKNYVDTTSGGIIGLSNQGSNVFLANIFTVSGWGQSGTESDMQLICGKGFIVANINCRIPVNTSAANGNITIRKNGVSLSSVVITAATTGRFNLTGISDVFAASDLINGMFSNFTVGSSISVACSLGI